MAGLILLKKLALFFNNEKAMQGKLNKEMQQ
jgi:hypothetical protein